MSLARDKNELFEIIIASLALIFSSKGLTAITSQNIYLETRD